MLGILHLSARKAALVRRASRGCLSTPLTLGGTHPLDAPRLLLRVHREHLLLARLRGAEILVVLQKVGHGVAFAIVLRRKREGDETPRVEADVAREAAGEVRRALLEVLGDELLLEKLRA